MRPENCEKLIIPLVNHKLWGKLKTHAMSQDMKRASVQRTIVKATIAITQATENITSFKGKLDNRAKNDDETLYDPL